MDPALKNKTSFNQVKKTSGLRGCGIVRLTSLTMVQTKYIAKIVNSFSQGYHRPEHSKLPTAETEKSPLWQHLRRGWRPLG